MSIVSKIRNRSHSKDRRTRKELDRALRMAPTRASREELLLLSNR